MEYEVLRDKAEKEIKQKGFEVLKKEKIDKLVNIFKEMLEYKNKKYDNNWSFSEWLEAVDFSYYYYDYTLKETLYIVEYRKLPSDVYEDEPTEISDADVIIALDELYQVLTNPEEDYKKYANYYKELELKDGETYSDLYDKELEKFKNLFKEMLDFLNVKYENDDFFLLSVLICEHYPYYTDIIINLRNLINVPNKIYISILYDMQKIYEFFSKEYKNHEKNMKEYQEEQENLEFIDDEDFI